MGCLFSLPEKGSRESNSLSTTGRILVCKPESNLEERKTAGVVAQACKTGLGEGG